MTARSTDVRAGFTYAGYRNMLERFRSRGYEASTFSAIDAAGASPSHLRPIVLWRHDIDFDLGAARRMAEIEASAGVRATYFIMVRTMHYNVFSADGSREVGAILELGHQLGLHFDCAAYDPGLEPHDLAVACRAEAEMLERWFGTNVDIVSYHRPSAEVLSGNPELSAPRPHTYMPRYTRDMVYYSDSRGEWKHGDPASSEAFREGLPLHILIHPIWWRDEPVSPYQALSLYLEDAYEALQRSTARNNTVFRVGRYAEEQG